MTFGFHYVYGRSVLVVSAGYACRIYKFCCLDFVFMVRFVGVLNYQHLRFRWTLAGRIYRIFVNWKAFGV